ncbi:conserved hypothetical protein [Kribbella flavida DSM 17836]|uniref:Glycoside hydrolase family 65 central catalytic n=1 Tax=Kribbella flavida (strain DSM 17836 / JCM 10339 / NBRC 14399) TaxID=479435 RepID=D2PS60_KRIFD|nr:hypothetical protein [Kribbella flavida]ADB31184.1 conserved hypothetical protein [Kribbella flavida DSM 17836]
MIDRRALVGRHDVELSGVVAESPLSVGNGELCFTVDVTGLQSRPERYPVEPRTEGDEVGTLLGTLSQWGWHSLPTEREYDLAETRREYSTPGGSVPYVDLGGEMDLATTSEPRQTDAEQWLRANPHRLDLGRIGFVLDGLPLPAVETPRQRLELWSGLIESSFVVAGMPVRVRTVCAPDDDVVAVRIESPALAVGLGVRFAFPYGSGAWGNAADWSRPDAHTTTVREVDGGWRIDRRLDSTAYRVVVGADDARLEVAGPHELVVTGTAEVLELRIGFAPGERSLPPAYEVVEAASRWHWQRFWESGAVVELAASEDPRGVELERRVVLSQYLTAVNCAGSLPPQETGLVCNSWRGRFHLEMHWWHGAHFALWGRAELLERSLGWYERVLPEARATAALQGYDGVRWPKQVGPDGRESPSSIGPFLIWQQPHPIYLAELIRRAASEDASGVVVERYGRMVLQTAEFMASYAGATDAGYQLGPPLIPAQESYSAIRAELVNPTFELAYWRWALLVAQQWRGYLGLEPDQRWTVVADGLVPAPVRDGCYAAIDGEPWTIRTDHPSMLYGLGVVPDTGYLDRATMSRTLAGVLDDWDWESTWGWDYPAIAMTAARLGDPATAVDALLLKATKNEYLPNGHNRQTPSLPLYLPGNGGLLAAVALMAAGWDGDDGSPAPGFPADGTWTVRHEGLHRSP